MNNQTAIDQFEKIETIRKSIHEAILFALENENWVLYSELTEIQTQNDKIWGKELDNAYPKREKVGA